MDLLLDTHALLWLIADDARLTVKARNAVLDTGNALHFSAASYWEICFKKTAGKLDLRPDWQKAIDRFLSINSIKWLEISKKHLDQTLRLPLIHRDPFDRLLVAQAMVEKLAILTIDENIHKYTVRTIW